VNETEQWERDYEDALRLFTTAYNEVKRSGIAPGQAKSELETIMANQKRPTIHRRDPLASIINGRASAYREIIESA